MLNLYQITIYRISSKLFQLRRTAVQVHYVALIGNHGIVRITHCRTCCGSLVTQCPLSLLLSMTYQLLLSMTFQLLLSMPYQFQSCKGKNDFTDPFVKKPDKPSIAI